MKHTRNAALLAALVSLTACEVATDPSKGKIRINNQAKWRIEDVYISSCDDTSWGADQMNFSLAPNLSTAFEVEPGCNDVRVVDEYGVGSDFTGYSVAAGQEITITYRN